MNHSLKFYFLSTLAFTSLFATLQGCEYDKITTEKTSTTRPAKVQIALLLDTSGSMSGLINQAKSQLWKIVNQFSHVYKNGRLPTVEVALYQYGSSDISASDDYLKQVTPLSDDLDKISEELFAFKTNGSEEYCGTVIRAANKGLVWSDNKDDFKVIFIAGNETFDQGSNDYRAMCAKASENGIFVNTIFCGKVDDGKSLLWEDGAHRGGGKYVAITHNKVAVYVAAPQDKELQELGLKINETYIPFGVHGKIGCDNQKVQDKNAQGYSRSSSTSRWVTKGSSNYNNYNWDLVDACKKNKVILKSLKKDQLPKNMQKMNLKEKEAYVKNMKEKRERYREKNCPTGQRTRALSGKGSKRK